MNVMSADKPHLCHLCGKRFGRRYSLRRHAENAHTEEDSEMDDQVDGDSQTTHYDQDHYEPRFKKNKGYSEVGNDETTESEGEEDEHFKSGDSESEREEENETLSEEDEESSSELEDNVAYRDWLEEAKEAIDEQWNNKYEKYTSEGMNEDQAREKADRKTHWVLKRIFFDKYMDFLSSYLHLKDDNTHQEVLEDIEEKVDKGMDINKALSRVMPRHHAKFKGLFYLQENEDS